jgi:hypothetical protein
MIYERSGLPQTPRNKPSGEGNDIGASVSFFAKATKGRPCYAYRYKGQAGNLTACDPDCYRGSSCKRCLVTSRFYRFQHSTPNWRKCFLLRQGYEGRSAKRHLGPFELYPNTLLCRSYEGHAEWVPYKHFFRQNSFEKCRIIFRINASA